MAAIDEKRVRAILRSRTLVYALLTFVSIMPAFWSLLMLTSPKPRILVWLFVISILMIPVGSVASVIGSWVLYAMGRARAALWLSVLPAVLLAICLAILGFMIITG